MSTNNNLQTEIILATQNGDADAVQAILDRVEPIIQAAVRKLSASTVPAEDLAQDARLAVLEAIPRFDVEAGNTVETFLRPRIHGAVMNLAGNYFSGLRLNHGVTDKYFAATAATSTPAEAQAWAKAEYGMSEEVFVGAHNAITGVTSISQNGRSNWEHDEDSGSSSPAEKEQPTSPDFSQAVTDNIVVRDAVAALPEKERLVIVMAFGLDGGTELNDREIGEALDLPTRTVNKIRQRASSMLRESIES